MTSPLLATRLLLDSLRPRQTVEAWAAARADTGVEWQELVVRAIAFGLAPQLHRRLESWSLVPPARPRAMLAATYKAQAQRNAAIFTQFEEILAAAPAYELQPLALKGIHLAAHWYPEPALRPMNDIDILFDPAEMDRVEAMMRALGYEGNYRSPELGAGVTKHTTTFRRPEDPPGSTPNPYLSAAAGRTVEPHLSLEESWYGLRVDITPGLRTRARPACFGDHEVLVQAPEDLLLHLCVHFSFHLIMGAPSLVQLSDLLLVSEAGAIEWQLLVERARVYAASPYSLAALSLARRLLGAPVPPATLEKLAASTPARLRRYLQGLTLADIMARTQQRPWRNTWERVWHGLRARAETTRWAPDWSTRARVWATALDLLGSDTGRAMLGRDEK